VVPEGTFQSTRVGKTRKGDDSRSRSDVLKATNSTVTRTYAPFPTAYPSQPSHYANSPQSSYSQLDDSYRSGLGQSSQQFRPPTSDIPQYSIPPPPPPPSHTLPPLPPLRPSYEDDYKFRRPSLPILPQSEHSPLFYDRRSSVDYSTSTIPPLARSRTDASLKPFADYHSPNGHGPSPAFGASTSLTNHSPPSSGVPRASEDFYSTRPCSYNLRASRSPPLSPSSHIRPPSTVGNFQPVSRVPDDDCKESAYSPPDHSASFPSPHSTSQVSLPPPAQLFRSDPPPQYEVASSADANSIGPQRVGLAPLHSLQRSHPYKRDPMDDRALRLLGPRSG
jgi:hypothetical protein